MANDNVKFCKDCKHLDGKNCTHPQIARLNRVTGEVLVKPAFDERHTYSKGSGVCGPSGYKWEAKDVS